MNTVKHLSLGTLVLLLGASHAYADQVECWAKVDGKTNVMRATIGTDGTFERTDTNGFLDAKEDSIFSLFALDLDRSGAETYDNFKAPNGYTIAKVVTTAEQVKVGVSADRTKGFYEYKDIGSGNGNSEVVLECKKI